VELSNIYLHYESRGRRGEVAALCNGDVSTRSAMVNANSLFVIISFRTAFERVSDLTQFRASDQLCLRRGEPRGARAGTILLADGND